MLTIGMIIGDLDTDNITDLVMARKGMWLNHNYKIATTGTNMFILL